MFDKFSSINHSSFNENRSLAVSQKPLESWQSSQYRYIIISFQITDFTLVQLVYARFSQLELLEEIPALGDPVGLP